MPKLYSVFIVGGIILFVFLSVIALKKDAPPPRSLGWLLLGVIAVLLITLGGCYHFAQRLGQVLQ